MDRITFLEAARQLACEQVVCSSALTDEEYATIQEDIENEEMNDEEALQKTAKAILEDASFNMDG